MPRILEPRFPRFAINGKRPLVIDSRKEDQLTHGREAEVPAKLETGGEELPVHSDAKVTVGRLTQCGDLLAIGAHGQLIDRRYTVADFRQIGDNPVFDLPAPVAVISH